MTKPTEPFDIVPYRPFDEPTVCLPINIHWVKILYGMVYNFRYPENWAGTLEENRQARADVLEIVDMLGRLETCMSDKCCTPVTVQSRVTTGGKIEVSYDGGQTYEPSPTGVGSYIVEQSPPVTRRVTATKCDAASNGLQHIQDWQARVSILFDTATGAVEFAVGVALIIADILLILVTGGSITAFETAILTAIGGICTGVWQVGKEIFDNYFTSDVWDTVLCTLYCRMSPDGSYTDKQFSQVIADLYAKLPSSIAKTFLIEWLKSVGRAGLNNICSYGNSADADCSSCDCDCNEIWDFSTGTIENVYQAFGAAVSGKGIKASEKAGAGNPPDTRYASVVLLINDCCPFYKLTMHFDAADLVRIGSGVGEAFNPDTLAPIIQGSGFNIVGGTGYAPGDYEFTGQLCGTDNAPLIAGYFIAYQDGGQQTAYIKKVEFADTPF